MRYFITGGSGLIGRRLVARVIARGDEAVVLTRDRQRCESVGVVGKRVMLVKGDATFLGAWRESVAGSDVIVNLAGENLFERRWDDAFRAKLRATRIETTKNLVAAIGNAPSSDRPKVLVSGSAVGYYGPSDAEEPLTETSRPGQDFLARLCVEWEEAARMASAYGTRVVVARTGLVLSPDGGAFPQMAAPFRMYMGGAAGDGRQWMSWIHVDDVVGLLLYAIDREEVRGPVNAVAPGAVRASEFAAEMGRALGKPAWFNVPKLLLKLRFGGVSEIVTSGQRVAPAAALQYGYIFRHKELPSALAECVKEEAAAREGAGAG